MECLGTDRFNDTLLATVLLPYDEEWQIYGRTSTQTDPPR